MVARLAMILVTSLVACGGASKAAPVPDPVAPPRPVEPVVDDDPPLASDTDIPNNSESPRRPVGDHTGIIRGTVTYATSGHAIAGVTVFLQGPDDMLTAITDDKGNYEITGVPPGTHQVTFSVKRTEVIAEVEVAAASVTVVPVAMTMSKTAPVIVN